MSVSGFMSDYYGMTHDNFIDPRSRVWSYSDRGEPLPLIMTDIHSQRWEGEEVVWLSAILSPEKQGKGMASYVIKKIAKLADKHMVKIWLTPKPYGRVENKLNKSQLTAWYRRNGWENAGQGMMVRNPEGKEVHSSTKIAGDILKFAKKF